MLVCVCVSECVCERERVHTRISKLERVLFTQMNACTPWEAGFIIIVTLEAFCD